MQELGIAFGEGVMVFNKKEERNNWFCKLGVINTQKHIPGYYDMRIWDKFENCVQNIKKTSNIEAMKLYMGTILST